MVVMAKLMDFQVFEKVKNTIEDWDSMSKKDKMGTLLYLSSPIQVEPELATEIIHKIGEQAKEQGWKRPSIDSSRVTLPMKKDGIDNLRDKLRWHDYLTRIVKAVTIRGFTTEGFIAGLYMGELTEKGSRPDVKVYDSKDTPQFVSIKSARNASERPTLASIKKALTTDVDGIIGTEEEKNQLLSLIRSLRRGVGDIFNLEEYKSYREKIWNLAFKDVDYFLIIFPGNNRNIDGVTMPSTLFFNVISSESLKRKFSNGELGMSAARSGDDKFELRLPSNYWDHFDIKFQIDIPDITDEELDRLYDKDLRDWGKRVFGTSIVNKMRTETLEDIAKQKEFIASGLVNQPIVRKSKQL